MKQQNLNSIKHEPKSANKELGDAQHMKKIKKKEGETKTFRTLRTQ